MEQSEEALAENKPQEAQEAQKDAEEALQEAREVAERQQEIMSEAKARGYDTMVMKKIIALRKRDRDDIAEEEAILDMYKAALGME